jgi:hypothetical protein
MKTAKTTSAILLAALGAQIALPLAKAGESQPVFTFSLGVPERGALDRYHNSFTTRDKVSDALYALRNVAVEDLLNTRKGLKLLIGGSSELKRLIKSHPKVESQGLTFDLPGGVIDLYLLGLLPGQTTQAVSGAVAPTATPYLYEEEPMLGPLTAQRVHGVDQELRPEIATTLRWLTEQEPAYDSRLRERMLLGLVFVSAQLAKFDQQIKFVDKDFLNTRPINVEYYQAEILPDAKIAAGAGAIPDLGDIYERNHKAWLTKHQMAEPLAAWAAQREYLLNRYHLLDAGVGGKPLYQRIYEKMEIVADFPPAAMIQRQ